VLACALALTLVCAAPAAAGGPRILATGDSMMKLTPGGLIAQLHPSGLAEIRTDIRVATGLTKPWMLVWREHAARQARRYRPDVVLAIMGANDVHPIRGVRCCSARWSRRYATRIEQVARAWRRGGVRRVYWLTLPIQAHARLEPVFSAVNRAVERARGIRVIDTRPVVTPGGRYVHELEVAPGDVRQIRAADGVHLWHAGARLVVDAIVARLRADGVISAAAPAAGS